jgi:flagellar assembly factor FliW
MYLNTKHFGEIEINEEKIVTFPDGIMGFEDKKRYVVINNYDTEEPVPFMWLQSIDEPDLAFVVTIPYLMEKDYYVDLSREDIDNLRVHEQGDLAIYSIVKIEDKVEDLTVNMLSPIVINANEMLGKQIVQYNTDFELKKHF